LKQKKFVLIINSDFLTQKNSSQNKKYEKKKKDFKIPIFDFLKKKFFFNVLSFQPNFNRILLFRYYLAIDALACYTCTGCSVGFTGTYANCTDGQVCLVKTFKSSSLSG
jgi:hypothetical protein